MARYDSWFDKTIVTRKGEDIFELLDDFAIKELRRHKLVWSSWGDDELLLPLSHQESSESEGNWRYVEFSDPERMRLFCLSLLWRAAVTQQPGFDTITLSGERLEIIRSMLLSNRATPFNYFPINLVQLTTKGGWHNQTPIKQVVDYEEPDGTQSKVGVYRFYMDGFIIRINDDLEDPIKDRHKGVALGESQNQLVITIPYEGSFQNELINDHMLDAITDGQKAKIVERIFGARRNL